MPNLFLADGWVCPTQGAANPALTIMALSSRLAERMASGAAMDDDPEARTGWASVTRNGDAVEYRERALTGVANAFSVSHLSWADV